jgi:STE24 endopeptidase
MSNEPSTRRVEPGGAGLSPADAKAYARKRYAFGIVTGLVGAAYLAALIAFGSPWLKWLATQVTEWRVGVIALYTILFTVIYRLVMLPLAFWREYLLEHRYRLSNLTVGRWVRDELVSFALSLVLIVGLVEVIYFLLDAAPERWWIWAAVAWVFLSIGLSRIYPVFIVPLFYSLTPIQDPELRSRIEVLAKRCGFRVEGIYRFNFSRTTKKAQALLTGFGRSRRVLLADTLLDSFSSDEVETVVAHELGHFVRADILRMFVWGTVFIIVSFYLADLVLRDASSALGCEGIADVAGLPLLVAVLMGVALVTLPLQNWMTRRMERACDLWGMRFTRKPEAFASAMKRLAVMNLVEVAPGRLAKIFFHSHPSVSERVALAEREMKRQAVAGS